MTERHPELAAMIEAARRQPTPPVRVSFDDIQAARQRRVGWWAGVAAAAAVLLAVSLWAMGRRHMAPDAQPDAQLNAQAHTELHAPPNAEPNAQPNAGSDATPASPAAVTDADASQPAPAPRAVALGAGATVTPLGEGGVRQHEDGGVSFSAGRFVVETADDALVLPVGARILQIRAASEVVVDTTLEHVVFEVRRGGAAWQDTAEPPSSEEPARRSRPGELLANAEAAMAAGRSEQAVQWLRKLVRKHPRSAAAKAGIMDLARLEKAQGRPRRAHCAYASFVRRFPNDSRTAAVRRADEALGVGEVRCRGLQPLP
jgi:hypothetical protein